MSVCEPAPIDPRIEALVNDVIGRVADKWTMLVLEVLTEHGELRFSRLADLTTGISQKMLTQTVRAMERDGLVIRTVHPVVPPRVEYRLTDLGFTLSEAATVDVKIERKYSRGEVAKCKRDANSEQARKRCKAYRGVLHKEIEGVAGDNSFKLSAKQVRKKLWPGKYRATLIATDADGASDPARVNFRVSTGR